MPNKDAILPQGRRPAFEALYNDRLLGEHETVSGAGSRLMNTARLRKSLGAMLASGFITSVLDAGCGDFNWLSSVPMQNIKYLGIDIVEPLIAENKKRWPDYQFEVGDIVERAPTGYDLILCKDLFTHLPHRDVMRAINNIKNSGARYIAITNLYPNYSKEKNRPSTLKALNNNSAAGYWRPMHLQAAPFNLPQPLVSLPEQQPFKTLDIWRTDSLHSFPS